MPNPDERTALEQAVRNEPRNASLRYLLGAELAQAREYDAAASELSQAIGLDPGLHMARFQLGLLYLTMRRPGLALETWAPLDSQQELALRQFKRGLEALVRDDFIACIEALEAGVRANQTNVPLNDDMQLIIGRAREALAKSASAPAQERVVRTDFSLYEP